jgi:glycosyltransferase involved in cell wall biosynthesis
MKPDAPFFSVIIPAYNAESTLASTLDSVLQQDFDDWEVIVVDDGSSDATCKVATRFAERDPRVRLRRQPNAGAAAARNLAASCARGDFLCLLDADDLYEPDYLRVQAAFIEANPGYDIYSCTGRLLFPDGSTEPMWTARTLERMRSKPSVSLPRVLGGDPIFVMAAIRARSFHAVGGFRPEVRRSEDFDLWIRMLAMGYRHVCNPVALGLYRRHESSKSHQLALHRRECAKMLVGLAAERSMVELGHADALLRTASRYVARAEREELIQDPGDYDAHAGWRRRFVKLRPGFESRSKFVLELAVVVLSPRLYSKLMRRRRREMPWSALYVRSTPHGAAAPHIREEPESADPGRLPQD